SCECASGLQFCPRINSVLSINARRNAVALSVMPVLCLFAACGGGGSNSPPPMPTAPSITTQPANQTVVVGQTAMFTVVAAGTAPLSYQWQKNAANISGATSASYTTPPTTLNDNGSQFTVTVSNSINR